MTTVAGWCRISEMLYFIITKVISYYYELQYYAKVKHLYTLFAYNASLDICDFI